MDLEGSLPYSQQSDTCPYPQPDQSRPGLHPISLNIIIIHPSTSTSSKRSLSLRFPHQNPVRTSLSPVRNWTNSSILDTTQRKRHKKWRLAEFKLLLQCICISLIYRFPVHVCSVCTPCNVQYRVCGKWDSHRISAWFLLYWIIIRYDITLVMTSEGDLPGRNSWRSYCSMLW